MKALLFTNSDQNKLLPTFKNIAAKYEIEFFIDNDIQKAFNTIINQKINFLIYLYDDFFNRNESKLLEMINSGKILHVLPIVIAKKIDKETLYKLYSKRLFYCFEIPEKKEEWNTLLNKAIFLYRNIINIYDTDTLIEERKKIILDNDLNKVASVINQLILNVNKITKNVKKIELALYEVIINAIEHGNFEIDGDTKKKAIQDNNYYDLLEQRKNDSDLSKRKVIIDYHLTTDYVKFVITDEGKGFNWKRTIEGDIQILNEHGRGILMIKNFFDKFQYNEKGNQVTLVKYKDY